ncbi:MAG: SPOR domain-containing protein [candidate division WOR-3 bacterium]|nr:MAG: SPOR domain-containing protein [candidate division WOR-3 bacterium]
MMVNALFLFNLISAFFLDSTLYTPHTDHALIATDFSRPIVDCVTEDFLYVATDDYIYKIEPAGLKITDKTPLPLRFNYLAIGQSEVILLSSNEIVILDRQNLGFKSGIGIERGDHQPIVKDQSILGSAQGRQFYLLSDGGANSILKVIDMRTGKIVRKMTMERVKCIVYDEYTETFAAVDIKNDLSIFDMLLRRTKKITLGFTVMTFTVHPEGFYIYSDQGIFLISRNGGIIDFQPTPDQQGHCGFFVLTKTGIALLDATVLRPYQWVENRYTISRLVAESNPAYGIGTDTDNNFYLIQADPIAVIPINEQRRLPEGALDWPMRIDSLWYLQLGAFAHHHNAVRAHETMRAEGVPVIIDSTDMYRIKFGGFSDKSTALDLAERMRLKGWFVYEPKLPISKPEVFYVNDQRYAIINGIVQKE